MKGQDWLVTDDGNCHVCGAVRAWELIRDNYRFYRFLTEVEDVLNQAIANEEDILNQAIDETICLPGIRRLVRQLILNSYWVQTQYLKPDSDTGVSVLILYDEIGYPLTVQTVTLAPGVVSPIHNHGTWGVVGIIKGQEKNTFWRRANHPDFPHKVERVGEMILKEGDIISFTPDAIHCIEAMGEEPTITFNIYGEASMSKRFEFDPLKASARNY
jgi:predicted metal-dependent enzyme (double-stranded beta helix superfamily)